MANIRISPDRLRDVAGQLDGQRGELESLLSQMKSLVDGLTGEWEGMAQSKYLDIFNTEVPKVQQTMSQVLEELTQEMRRIAQVFEETDASVI